jgi:hypothetical protein
MIRKDSSSMWGLKFFGPDGSVLLSVGFADNISVRNDPCIVINVITLDLDERLIGIKSCGDGWNMALHYNLQWIISRDPVRFNFVKLFMNRKENNSVRSVFKLPEGVIREVIKYVRY